MPWWLRRKTSASWRLRLPVCQLRERRSYWSSRHPKMRCLLFIPRWARTRKPWWKTIRKPWSRFSLMATDVVRSNMASTVTGQGFRMTCLTLPTHLLQSFFVNLGCPPTPTPIKAKAVEVHLVEIAKDPVEGIVVEKKS